MGADSGLGSVYDISCTYVVYGAVEYILYGLLPEAGLSKGWGWVLKGLFGCGCSFAVFFYDSHLLKINLIILLELIKSLKIHF